MPTSDSGEFPDESSLKNQLIEKIMKVTAIAALIALATTQVRAFQIGWSQRDLLQTAAVCLILFLALNHQLNIEHKVPFLLAAFVLGGIGGIGTLGMFAGMVFILPISAVIAAIFYPPKITVLFTLGALLFYGVVASGFCLDILKLPETSLMAIPRHWGVYIACAAFFFAVSGAAIYNYRKVMRQLVLQVRYQRDELTEVLAQVKTLKGLLPICSSCKKIRDDDGYWDQIENYIADHSDAQCSHAICPDCMKKLYPEFADEVNKQVQALQHPVKDQPE
jgi:hypothetical protein